MLVWPLVLWQFDHENVELPETPNVGVAEVCHHHLRNRRKVIDNLPHQQNSRAPLGVFTRPHNLNAGRFNLTRTIKVEVDYRDMSIRLRMLYQIAHVQKK